MKNAEPYDIISDNSGSLFCKCEHLEDGSIRLIGKNTSISLNELQIKALDPRQAKKTRGKRYHTAQSS